MTYINFITFVNSFPQEGIRIHRVKRTKCVEAVLKIERCKGGKYVRWAVLEVYRFVVFDFSGDITIGDLKLLFKTIFDFYRIFCYEKGNFLLG